jgi:hypothetical protein
MVKTFSSEQCYLALCYAISVANMTSNKDLIQKVSNMKDRLNYSYIKTSIFKVGKNL